MQGHAAAARALVRELGADLTARNKEGLTPAELAREEGHDQCAHLLLDFLRGGGGNGSGSGGTPSLVADAVAADNAATTTTTISVVFEEEGPIGITFECNKDGSSVVVASIAEGSQAAAKPGLVAGMVVHSVASMPVHQKRAQEVMQILALECGQFLRPKAERAVGSLAMSFSAL
eukprot:COSAG01_NODE_16150_length_1265_cov_2.197256_2_plen_175_part_00